MGNLQQWAVSLCGAAVIGGVISSIASSSGIGKAVRILASLMFLCTLITPIRGIFSSHELPAFQTESASNILSQEIEENAQNFAYLLAQSNINEMIKKTLSDHQIYPKDSQVVLKNEDGSIEIHAVLYFSSDQAIQEETIKNLIRQTIGVEVECQIR